VTLDLPALRKLLADYREWLSDDNPTRPWDPRLDFQEALLASAGALLRAAEERDALLAAATVVAQWFGHPSGCAWKLAQQDMVAVPRSQCDCGVFAMIDAIRLAKEPR